ncbi:MAG: GvpH [Methanofollis sp.]|nr:GvpH [Methanofollis sp.]
MSDKIPDEDFRQLTDYLKGMVLRALEDCEDKPIAIGVQLLVRDGHCLVLPPTWAPAKTDDVQAWTETDEPAVEMIEVGGRVVVTVELPGMSEEDLLTRQDGSTLVIDARDDRRHYRLDVSLPETPLDMEAISFRHGVLEIVLGPESDTESRYLYR